MSDDFRTLHKTCGGHEDAGCAPDGKSAVAGAIGAVAHSKTTRRTFIKGVIASGAAISASGYVLRPGEAKARAAGAVDRMVSLKINGQTKRVDVSPNETLAFTLRNKLNLTGTKLGCDRGECGACTVIAGDTAIYSCTTLTHQISGQEITTVEGVAKDGKLHPVQQAFIDEIGPQCGFCTPGQVMSAVALLKANPKPTREQARRAMSGNLCRCGSYEQYLAGVMRAAKGG